MNFLLGWPIFRGYVSFREGTARNFLLVQDLFSSTGNKTHLSLLLRGRDPFLAISVDQVDDTALSSTQHHATPVFPQRANFERCFEGMGSNFTSAPQKLRPGTQRASRELAAYNRNSVFKHE